MGGEDGLLVFTEDLVFFTSLNFLQVLFLGYGRACFGNFTGPVASPVLITKTWIRVHGGRGRTFGLYRRPGIFYQSKFFASTFPWLRKGVFWQFHGSSCLPRFDHQNVDTGPWWERMDFWSLQK